MTSSFDLSFVLGLQHLVASLPWMIPIVIFLARWLILVEIALALSLLVFHEAKKRRATYESAWAAGIALIITSLLSRLFSRPRPFLSHVEVMLLIPPPFNTSFPSGHTATAVAIACALFGANKKMGIAAFVLAACIALGRMAAGVHYPSDILGGVCVGLVSYGIVRLVRMGLQSKGISLSAALHRHS